MSESFLDWTWYRQIQSPQKKIKTALELAKNNWQLRYQCELDITPVQEKDALQLNPQCTSQRSLFSLDSQ